MGFRKAEEKDIEDIADIYDAVHTAEEQGLQTIGWIRGVYPVRSVAEASLKRGDLYVYEEEGSILASAIINKLQVDCYKDAAWQYDAPDERVMVIHTLVVHPKAGGRGIGRKFIGFYEDLAVKNNAPFLRMDTNERNVRARALYKKLGYSEPDTVPTVFNGIPGVNLVLLEKKLDM